MGKLHELLAVEGDLEGTFKRIMEEAKTTFSKKPDHFMAQQRVLTMFADERQNENSQEFREMVTTVWDKLDYVQEHVVRYFDAVLQKEQTNQIAKADLIVDGNVVMKEVPATFLLGMESKLKMLREIYESVPTLQPGAKWEPAPELGKGVYRAANPIEKMRTQKTIQHKVLVQPTKEHPAQVEKWTEDIAVGKYVETTQCSMWTPAEKSLRIGKVDKLIQACKQARQRANCQEVKEGSIAKLLFDYINS